MLAQDEPSRSVHDCPLPALSPGKNLLFLSHPSCNVHTDTAQHNRHTRSPAATSSAPANSEMSPELPPSPACTVGASPGASWARDGREQDSLELRDAAESAAAVSSHRAPEADPGLKEPAHRTHTCGHSCPGVFTAEQTRSKYNPWGRQSWRFTGLGGKRAPTGAQHNRDRFGLCCPSRAVRGGCSPRWPQSWALP